MNKVLEKLLVAAIGQRVWNLAFYDKELNEMLAALDNPNAASELRTDVSNAAEAVVNKYLEKMRENNLQEIS